MELTESVKKADKPRYWLTFLLNDFDVGDTFKPDELHLTIVPWFVTELDQAEVIKSFERKFMGQKALKVRVGGLGEFRNKRKIPINFVTSSAQLKHLHSMALEWLSDLDARWAVQEAHVGKDFVPHIRRRPGHNVSELDDITLQTLNLVVGYRRGDDLRTLAAKVYLDEK